MLLFINAYKDGVKSAIEKKDDVRCPKEKKSYLSEKLISELMTGGNYYKKIILLQHKYKKYKKKYFQEKQKNKFNN